MAQWFEMLMEGVERNLASRNRERYNNVKCLIHLELTHISVFFHKVYSEFVFFQKRID